MSEEERLSEERKGRKAVFKESEKTEVKRGAA